MRTSILVAAIATCALSVPVASAQDTAVPEQSAMGMDMGRQMTQMQQNMAAMHVQMEQLRATTDPKERQRLLQAHMQAMQDNMKTMREMTGPMVMNGSKPGGMAMGGGKAMSDGKPMAGGDMMQRHQMMENRMGMMQMMMEQMLQHQQAMESMPAK